MTLSAEETQRLSEQFECKTPQEILAWAIERFWPDVALSSSFQTQSIPLLHMAIQMRPDIRILFLDAGLHFWETLIFRERMEMDWHLSVVDLRRDSRWDNFCQRYGRDLLLEDPNLCCYIQKVQPMQKVLEGLRAWVTGIRRDRTEVRAHARILELQPDGLLKINPLLNWTKQDVQTYITAHNLPAHPLLERGYRSVGCAPCTRPAAPDEPDLPDAGPGAARPSAACTPRCLHRKTCFSMH